MYKTKRDYQQTAASFSFQCLDDKRLTTFIGLNKQRFDNFKDMINFYNSKQIRNSMFTLSIYLFKMKSGHSDKVIGALVNRSQQNISCHINRAKVIIYEQFVLHYLRFAYLTCDDVL